MGAVEPGERLHRLNTGQALVDVHGVQERLIESRLVLLRHQQHLVFGRREVLRQLLLADAGVYLFLGVGHPGGPVVPDLTGEGDQRLDRIPLARYVAVEALLVTHRLEARSGHHHRLGAAPDPMASDHVEVLDHHLGLLHDVVRVQPYEAGKRLGRVLPLHVGIVRAFLEHPVVGGVGRIVLEDVQDESLLGRLPHRVAMGGPAVAPEYLQRLVLRRRGEREETHVRLPPALGHADEQLLDVRTFEALVGGALASLRAQLLPAQHLLERGRGFASLGAMRFVDDHRATTGRQHARRRRAPRLGHREKLA